MVRRVTVEGLVGIDGRHHTVVATEDKVHLVADRQSVTRLSKTLRDLYEDMALDEGDDNGDGDAVAAQPVPVIGMADVVERVLAWCEHRAAHMDDVPYAGKAVDERVVRQPVLGTLGRIFVDDYDREFMIGVEGLAPEGVLAGRPHLLPGVLNVATFLDIEWLKDLCVAAIAGIIRQCRTADAVREQTFGLPPATDADRDAVAAAHQHVPQTFAVEAVADRAQRRYCAAEEPEV